jgi:putative methanogenesis marker protein 8
MRYHLLRHRGGLFKIYEDLSIEVVEKPKIKYCPAVEFGYGIKEINLETAIENLKYKIMEYGLFTPRRRFDSTLFVPFGASEMISTSLKDGLLDLSITVCDGAGSVLTDNPDLVQGIGARLTGIVKTFPIREIIDYIERNGGLVLDRDNAEINVVKSIEKALELGYKKIAITISGYSSKDIDEVRRIEDENKIKIVIFGVCNTGISKEDAERLLRTDLVWASASKYVREIVGPKAILQVGLSIPVFILSNYGKKIVLNHLKYIDYPLVIHRIKPPYLKKGPEPLL